MYILGISLISPYPLMFCLCQYHIGHTFFRCFNCLVLQHLVFSQLCSPETQENNFQNLPYKKFLTQCPVYQPNRHILEILLARHRHTLVAQNCQVTVSFTSVSEKSLNGNIIEI